MKFRTDPQRIRGSIAPLVTPFTGSGELDLASLLSPGGSEGPEPRL